MALDLKSFAIGKASGGGGGGITVEKLTATENGTYTAESGKAFNPVVVDVNTGFDMSVTENQLKLLVNITENTKDLYVFTGETVEHGVQVDFGDGTEPRVSEGIASLSGGYYIHHIYDKKGYYVITFEVLNGNMEVPYGGSNECGARILQGATNIEVNRALYYKLRPYQFTILEMSVGDNISVAGLSFLGSLRSLPKNKIVSSGALACYSLSEINLEGYTSIPQFTDAKTLTKVKIPKSATSFISNAFRNCSSLQHVDFTDIELVNGEIPITFGNTPFYGTSPSLVILFATQEIAEVAKNTTNLATYASYIHYVGEEG